MKLRVLLSISVITTTLFLLSCEKTENDAVDLQSLPLPQLSSSLESYDDIDDLSRNPFFRGIPGGQQIDITDAGATLGRVLFYDPRLSINNRISCGSCHSQKHGFADPRQFSEGFAGKITSRNAMSIANPSANNHFFWDSRVSRIEELALEPVRNHIEMGMEKMDDLVLKLNNTSYYSELFHNAFSSEEISPEKIASALSQFMCSLISVDSRMDQGLNNGFANFSELERLGQELFFGQKAMCGSCHSSGNFSAPDFPGGGYSQPDVQGTANIGLQLVYTDNGKHEGQFKIPSLRNIGVSAPYMHDGRFKTLEEVVEHYDNGIALHKNLDSKFRTNDGARKLNLSAIEKLALVAFLNTLTDEKFLNDERYSDPFKY
ncbi:MAG: cytochrome-c peroxidase [Saprospiraceae bacterium]|nr:cytochrome-c peroxidase [Saprospiraceae bacterium]